MQADQPNRHVRFGSRSPRVGGWTGSPYPIYGTGDDVDRHARTSRNRGDLLAPKDGEVGRHHLGFGRQVEPDLEQLERIRLVLIDEREHLGVHDPRTRGEPLGVSTAVSSGGTQRIRVVNVASPDHRDCFEPTMWMLRETGYPIAVVHAPSVLR